MNGAAAISLQRFALIYLLLLVVLAVMKKAQINQSKLLFVAGLRMSLQLVLAGFILSYIFEHPHPLFTLAYLLVMIAFACYRVLARNPHLNRRFKWVIGLSLGISGLFVLGFFVLVVINQSLFNPQYVIPLSGMIMGNAMTGVNLGVKTFHEYLESEKLQIETLLNLGCDPADILRPFANRALETALLPTLNSMLGMGIVALPGMMTGQIISGTSPNTAILYQIAIMIALCTAVCLAVFGSLYGGYRSLYNKRNQIQLG